MAREAAPEEAANCKLRRLLAYNESFDCAGVAIGDSVLFHNVVNRKAAPRRCGPTKILDTDEAGAAF